MLTKCSRELSHAPKLAVMAGTERWPIRRKRGTSRDKTIRPVMALREPLFKPVTATMRDWAPGANRVLARGFVAGIPGFESCAPQEFALLSHVDGTERKVYSGREHRRCNRQTATHRGRAR